MSAPFFSIVIPVYNAEPYLPACLKSLFAQTCPDFEIILVDDGSTDGSGRICSEAARRDPRVRAFTEPNLGSCLSRNRGLQEARGKFVWSVDNDDLAHPRALERFKECLSSRPRLDGLALRHDTVDEGAPVAWAPCESPLQVEAVDLESPESFPPFYSRRFPPFYSRRFPLSVYDYVLRRETVPPFIPRRDVRCEGRIWQDAILLDSPARYLGETGFVFYHYIQHPHSFIHKRGTPSFWANTLGAFEEWMDRPLAGRGALIRKRRDCRLLSMLNNDFLFTLLTLEPGDWDSRLVEWIAANRRFFASHSGSPRKRIRFLHFSLFQSRRALSFFYPKTSRMANSFLKKRGEA